MKSLFLDKYAWHKQWIHMILITASILQYPILQAQSLGKIDLHSIYSAPIAPRDSYIGPLYISQGEQGEADASIITQVQIILKKMQNNETLNAISNPSSIPLILEQVRILKQKAPADLLQKNQAQNPDSLPTNQKDHIEETFLKFSKVRWTAPYILAKTAKISCRLQGRKRSRIPITFYFIAQQGWQLDAISIDWEKLVEGTAMKPVSVLP